MAINPDKSTATEEQKNASAVSTFRKINLNVDIATQAELISAYEELTAQIGTVSDAYKTADQQLSTDLKNWATGAELSGELHQEVVDEATRADTVEQAISATLSTFALSTTVADAYKVTVEHTDGTLAWTIKQGAEEGTTITIPADAVVSAGTVEQVGDKKYLVLSLANANNVSIDVDDLVDLYEGEPTDFADVEVNGGKIKAYVSADAISSAATDYVDTVSAAINTRLTAVESVADTVTETSATWDEISAKIDTATVVNAANQLSGLALSALEDYQDIDMIISEVEKIKGALINFTTALEA